MLVMVATTMLVAAGPEDGVKEAGAGWRQGAISRTGRELLEKYLSDDLVYTHGGGQSETKAQYIANVLKGPSHYQAMVSSNTRVRLYGKTAVLLGPRGRDAWEGRDLSHAHTRGIRAARKRHVANGSKEIGTECRMK